MVGLMLGVIAKMSLAFFKSSQGIKAENKKKAGRVKKKSYVR